MVSFATDREANAAEPPGLDAAEIEECPSSADLRRAIVTHLGRDAFDRAEGAPRVWVHVLRTASGALVADVTVERASSTATHRIDGGGGTCSDLVRAAALSIALAMEAEPSPSQPPHARAVALESPRPEPGPQARRDLRDERWLVLAAGVTQLGLLASASSGAGGHARLRVADHVWVGARGLFLPEARMPNDAFGTTLAAGGLGACAEPFGWTNVAASGCAHVLAGSLAAVSPNVSMANGGAKPFGAGALSANVRTRVVGPLVLEGAVEAIVPFGHPALLTATCPSAGFQQPFAALLLGFGVGVSIP